MATRDEDWAEHYKTYLNGCSAAEIGAMLGVQAGTIIYHFKKRNFKLRTHKEALQNRSSDYKIKISNSLKRKHKNGELTCWQKGLTKETDQRLKQSAERNKYVVDYFGYKKIWYKGERVFEHHKIICHYLSWPFIPNNLVVHHKDGNKLNNNICNLIVLTRALHAKLHYEEQKMNDKNRIYWGANNGRV